MYSKAKESMQSIVGRVEALAKEKGCSMAQLSLAWIMARPGVTAPIVGTTSLENLADLIGECRCSSESKAWADKGAGAVDIKLSEDDMKYLEEPYAPQEIIGHW